MWGLRIDTDHGGSGLESHRLSLFFRLVLPPGWWSLDRHMGRLWLVPSKVQVAQFVEAATCNSAVGN